MTEIKLVAYGIAKDIIGDREIAFQAEGIGSISALKKELVLRYPKFESLVKFSLAVNEEYQEDGFVINEGDEVVIIPPVSGG